MKVTSRPQFFLSYEDMNTESKNNSNNENNKSPKPGRRRIQIEDIRYARKKILSGFCDGGVVATAFGESSSSSSPVVVREEASRRAMEGLPLLEDEDDSDDD